MDQNFILVMLLVSATIVLVAVAFGL